MVAFEENKQLGAMDPLRIWVMPDAQHRYVIGADVAEGLEHGDYSCAQVLDVNTGEQVAQWHGHIPAREFGQQLALLGRFYNTALVGCEANNHGISSIDALRDLNYPRIFRKRTVGETSVKTTIKWGWHTNRQTKPLMIDGLDDAIRQEAIVIYDRYTIGELRTYVRDEKGHLHGSPHDDRVVALAIAVQMLNFAHVPAEEDPFRLADRRYSIEWWVDKARGAEKPEIHPIGYHNRRRHYAA